MTTSPADPLGLRVTVEQLRAQLAEQDRLLAIMSQDSEAYRAGRDAGLEEAAGIVERGAEGATIEDAIALGPNGAIAKAIRRRMGALPLTLATHALREALREIVAEIDCTQSRPSALAVLMVDVKAIARKALGEDSP